MYVSMYVYAGGPTSSVFTNHINDEYGSSSVLVRPRTDKQDEQCRRYLRYHFLYHEDDVGVRLNVLLDVPDEVVGIPRSQSFTIGLVITEVDITGAKN